MSLPTTSSRFPGECPKCKTKYSKGTTIYKINEQYWCSNPNCPEPENSQNPQESPVDIDAKLDQLWQICFTKASKIIDETYTDQELPDKFERKKQKLILAQTFIKSVCGHGD